MTPLVLVILAVMWILVLVPPLLRSRTDGRPNHSISSFQHQLRTLQRTGGHPTRASVTYLRAQPPARRAPATQSRAMRPRYDDGYGAGDGGHDDAYGYDDGYGYGSSDARGYRAQPAPRRASMRTSRYAAAAQREALRRRRQNVLAWLAGATFFTAVLAFGMGMTPLRWVAVGCGVALVLYVVLLVQLRRAAELRSYRSSWSRMAA